MMTQITIFFLINKNFIEKERIHTSTQVVNLNEKTAETAKKQKKNNKLMTS
jgi:hypothetical protein